MKEYMIAKREAQGLSMRQMARKCDCSDMLLLLLESHDSGITHPKIAARIAREYGLTVDEYNTIVHEKYRVDKLPEMKKTKKIIGSSVFEVYKGLWKNGRGGKSG